MKVKSLSRVRLFVTPWTVAHQAPLSLGFSRHEHWSGCHRLLWQAGPLPLVPPGKPCICFYLDSQKKSYRIRIMYMCVCVSHTHISVYCFREGNGTPLQYSCLENPMDRGAWWAAVHGVAEGQTRLSDFSFTFHFPALEKEMATHSSVLAWRIPGTGEPGGLPSMGSHRVGHD